MGDEEEDRVDEVEVEEPVYPQTICGASERVERRVKAKTEANHVPRLSDPHSLLGPITPLVRLALSPPTTSTMSTSTLLPGQPVKIPKGPAPQLGSGTYSRDGQIRASVVGAPQFQGSVGLSLPTRLWYPQ